MNMMNMTNSSGGSMMNMTVMSMMPFHTAVGFDMLWFAAWMPGSAASTFGSCVGLFFLAAFYRFLFAVRNIADFKWASNYPSDNSSCCSSGCEYGKPIAPGAPPFLPSVDPLRGLLEGFTSAIGYFLMLVVMLMNAWFFIAIILGIIFGETFFGRFASVGINVKHRVC